MIRTWSIKIEVFEMVTFRKSTLVHEIPKYSEDCSDFLHLPSFLNKLEKSTSCLKVVLMIISDIYLRKRSSSAY